MSLTRDGGPLSAKGAPPANYEIDGPRHRLLWGRFPRRVRGEVAGETVFDTETGHLLHESGLLPVLYVPERDVRFELLVPSDHHTHCPFKGDASYWHLEVGGHRVADAVWSYPEPIEGVPWLAGNYAFYWKSLDAWYDEGERVHRHLRDPYHRVDVRRGSRSVTVSVLGVEVARSERPWVLSETGLPSRVYVPREDVDFGPLAPSDTVTRCPYKGDARHWSFETGDALREDIAWSFEEPFDDAVRVAGAVCFSGDDVKVRFAPDR